MNGASSGCLLGAALVAALALGAGAASAQESDICHAPRAFLVRGAPLSHTGGRLQNGEAVRIVAIGSSSTAGTGASGPDHAYPAQLESELRQRFPKSEITVLNKGVAGEETPGMLERFGRDVFNEHPDLVVWQVGSNEILHKDANPAVFEHQVEDGLDRLKAAHIEAVLMDVQYVPAVLDNPKYPSFNDALLESREDSNVALLDRFGIMRYWHETNRRAWTQMVAPDNVHMTDQGYNCLARLLTALIASDLPALASR